MLFPCALLALGSMLGCSQGDADTVELADQGTLCVYADQAGFAGFGSPEPQQFTEGSKLVATVQVPHCLSASCDVDRDASCVVAQMGNVLVVDSYITWRPLESDACTMDCIKLTATCESAPLAAGDYEIHFGNDSAALSVPSLLDAPCGT